MSENSDNNNERILSNFYGQNIESIKCLVGKNGSGKTSIIEFLSTDFLEYFNTENFSGIPVENEKSIQFIAIFSVDNEMHYLTNIDNIEFDSEIKQYVIGSVNQTNDLWEIFDFSHSIEQFPVEISNIVGGKDVGYFDYSQETLLSQNDGYDNLKKYIHSFLEDITQNNTTFLKKDSPLNYILDECGIKVPSTGVSERFVDLLVMTLSSGQLSKLILLSKLYWCFILEKVGEYYQYDSTNRESKTSIIFIDEGELYYHPNWQREFIDTLLYLLNKASLTSFQLIITTNSPFLLSDIFEKDIYFLPNNEGKKTRSFGQNIHTLLSSSFFMNYTIGEYSRKIIDGLLDVLSLAYLEPFLSLSSYERNYTNKIEDIEGEIAKLETFYKENSLWDENSSSADQVEIRELCTRVENFDYKNEQDNEDLNIKYISFMNTHKRKFQKKKLQELFTKRIQNKLPMIDTENWSKDIHYLIDQIGEDMYRYHLREQLERAQGLIFELDDRKKQIENQIQFLQNQLNSLKVEDI